MKTQSNKIIEKLKGKVKGQIVLPDDPNYKPTGWPRPMARTIAG